MGGRSRIVVNRDLAEVSAEALAALVRGNDPPTTFVRAGLLMEVVEDENEVAHFVPLIGTRLRSKLARVSGWCKRFADGRVTPCYPPMDVVCDLETLTPWRGIPPVRTLSACPVMSASGRVRTLPGYHEEARCFFTSCVQLQRCETREEALELIFSPEALGEFPFVDEASRAGALALMLLPFVRPAIEGPTPLHLFEAPASRTGKSLCVSACLLPGVGPVEPTAFSRDEEGLRKLITSMLYQGYSAVFIDNISRKLDSDSLCAVLTSTVWTDRVLGQTGMVTVPNYCCWAATGNNCELSTDMFGRTVFVRLDAAMEDPGERQHFTHPDLLVHMTRIRGRLWGACIRLVEDWVSVGMPCGSTHSLGGFEGWERTMGGILEVAGVPGFLSNRGLQRARAVTDDAEWVALVEAWWSRFGPEPVTTTSLFEALGGSDCFLAIAGSAKDPKRSMGTQLGRRKDRIFGGFRVREAARRDGYRRFRLLPVDDPFGDVESDCQ